MRVKDTLGVKLESGIHKQTFEVLQLVLNPSASRTFSLVHHRREAGKAWRGSHDVLPPTDEITPGGATPA